MDDNDELIVVDYKQTFYWKDKAPSQLRLSLSRKVTELRTAREAQETESESDLEKYFNRLKFNILEGRTKEAAFRIGDIPYMASTCLFQWFYLEKTDSSGSRKHTALAEWRHEHAMYNVNCSIYNSPNSAFMMRAYPLPDENQEQCRQLLRFVAACTIRAGSITQFALSVLRCYENNKNTIHVFPRAIYGSIADIMRALHITQNGRSALEDGKIGSALPPQYTLYFSACILQALQFLWDKGISVNRMSTETVQVTETQIPVLTDFLYASRCDQDAKQVMSRRLTETPRSGDGDLWPAPELAESPFEDPKHGRVDVWNFGLFVLMVMRALLISCARTTQIVGRNTQIWWKSAFRI